MAEGLDDWIAATAQDLRAAALKGERVSIEGAGTRCDAVGPAAGRRLSSADYRGILAYDPGDLVVTVRSGTPLDDLESELDLNGQMLGFEPPRRPHSTVGGAVALGWAGSRRPFAGAVRDCVTGIRLIDGLGRTLSFGGPVVKNVAGFDVPRLAAGSLGILGMLLDISLRVIPKPAVERTCSTDCDAIEALDLMDRLRIGPGMLSAACWVDGRLLLRFSGSDSSVDAHVRQNGGRCAADGAGFWRSIVDQTHGFFTPRAGRHLWRLSVRLGAPPFGEAADTLIDWGGALRWVWLPPEAETAVIAWACRHGGHATPWPMRRAAATLPADLLKLQHRLADVFDPARILGRERLLTPLDEVMNEG